MQLSPKQRETMIQEYNALKQKLHARECDVSAKILNNFCMLDCVAALGDLEEVKWLIELHLAPISSKSLYYALCFGNIAVARYLSEKKPTIIADIRLAALKDASEESKILYKEKCQLLIHQKLASPNGKLLQEISGTNTTYFDLAKAIHDYASLEIAYDQIVSQDKYYNMGKKPLLAADERGNTLLHHVAEEGDAKTVRDLIARGAAINAQNRLGQTPIYLAVLCGNQRVIQVLVESGADIKIPSFDGETIYHAQSHRDVDLSFIDEDFDTTILKTATNIFGQTPKEYAERDQPNFSQSLIIAKLQHYCNIQGGSDEFFHSAFESKNEGLCNALTFLHHQYDSRKNLALFYEVLATFLQWDGTKAALDEKPSASLTQEFKLDLLKVKPTLKAVFESFFSYSAILQAGCMVQPSLMVSLHQRYRKQQLALVADENHIKLQFPDIPLDASREQIAEFLQIIANLPKGFYVEISRGKHLTGLKVSENQQLVYYDANFRAAVTAPLSVQSATSLIINTKYLKLNQENSDGTYPIAFMVYQFQWQDRVPERFNYFTENQLPKSVDEANAFVTHSPCGFNPLHIAIITHSKDNLRKLIADGFCDLLQATRFNPPITPLELLYSIQDTEMLDIYLSSQHLLLDNPAILLQAHKENNIDFINRILTCSSTTNVQSLFKVALDCDDVTLVQKIFELNKVDKSQMLALVLSALSKTQDERLVNSLLENYQGFVDGEGKNFSRLFFNESLMKTITFLGPNCIQAKAAMSFFDQLPTPEDIETRNFYLHVLHTLGEPFCSKYCDNLCKNIEQIGDLAHENSKLLARYVYSLNPIIVESIIKRLKPTEVNAYSSDSSKNVLHLALLIAPTTDEGNAAVRKIVELLLSHGVDVNHPDNEGNTCLTLLQNHTDPFIRDLEIPDVQHRIGY